MRLKNRLVRLALSGLVSGGGAVALCLSFLGLSDPRKRENDLRVVFVAPLSIDEALGDVTLSCPSGDNTLLLSLSGACESWLSVISGAKGGKLSFCAGRVWLIRSGEA